MDGRHSATPFGMDDGTLPIAESPGSRRGLFVERGGASWGGGASRSVSDRLTKSPTRQRGGAAGHHDPGIFLTHCVQRGRGSSRWVDSPADGRGLWKPPSQLFFLSDRDDQRTVHGKRCNRRPAGSGQPVHDEVAPFEMIAPRLCSRVEKAHRLIGQRVSCLVAGALAK